MAKRQLLINLVLLVGIFFIVVFGVVTMWAEIQAESTKLSTANDEAQALETLLATQKRLASKRTELERNSDRFSLAVPLKRDVPTILTELEAITEKLGSSILLDDFAIGSDGPVEGLNVANINQLGFKVTLTGTYNNLNLFLAEIEKNLPLINIERFDFTPDITETGSFGITTFTLNAVTYYITDSHE